jgi:hypothetical protein
LHHNSGDIVDFVQLSQVQSSSLLFYPFYLIIHFSALPNDHVVRNSASSVLGDLIPAQTLGSEYSKTYTVSIPTSWNKQRLSIAAIVVQSNNSVLNARKAVVGQSQDFQLIQ